MCGIIGFIGTNGCFEYLYNGLESLQNRGYDSAGICSINAGKFIVDKFATTNEINSLKRLKNYEFKHNDSTIGIGHTRWSTHGSKTNENAHPHLDHKNKIAIVHNGIIDNFQEIKNALKKEYNINFRSETDSEVIVNLISVYYDEYQNMENAINQASKYLHGTWALVILNLDEPDNLYCIRHGSPLLIGCHDSYILVASEQSGFCGKVDKFTYLKDDDLVIINKKNESINFVKKSQYDMKDISLINLSLKPDPYPHWTIAEIHEQKFSSARSFNCGGRIINDTEVRLGGFDNKKNNILNTNHLIILGCGTSYFAGLYGSNFFKELSGLETVQVIDGGEFSSHDIPKKGATTLILLSQSGETKDLHRCIEIGRDNSLFMIGIVNVVDSLIAREVDCGCYLNAGREVGVASTKSFTSQIIVLSLIAIWLAQNKKINETKRKEYVKELIKLPNDIEKTLSNVEDMAKNISKFLLDKHSCFILGKGWCESIAKEGALKIKELGYIHAEGYSAVALKHGPFSLLDDKTPVIFVNPNDENHGRVNNAIEEVKARGAPIILITDSEKHEDIFKYIIKVPNNTIFKGILHIIPLQFIAYYLSLFKGNNPDMPRNLAKAITVN